MPTIYERVHARSDLDEMRANKDIPGLIEALNAESVLKPVPIQVAAFQIFGFHPQRDFMLNVLRDAADGKDISQVARDLLSPQGASTTENRMDPPLVQWGEVINALYNDDGTEK